MNTATLVLTQIANILAQATTAAPIVEGIIAAAVGAFRNHAAANGEPDPFDGMTTDQIIDLLETDLRANVNFGDEEIARLKAKLTGQDVPPAPPEA